MRLCKVICDLKNNGESKQDNKEKTGRNVEGNV